MCPASRRMCSADLGLRKVPWEWLQAPASAPCLWTWGMLGWKGGSWDAAQHPEQVGEDGSGGEHAVGLVLAGVFAFHAQGDVRTGPETADQMTCLS